MNTLYFTSVCNRQTGILRVEISTIHKNRNKTWTPLTPCQRLHLSRLSDRWSNSIVANREVGK